MTNEHQERVAERQEFVNWSVNELVRIESVAVHRNILPCSNNNKAHMSTRLKEQTPLNLFIENTSCVHVNIPIPIWGSNRICAFNMLAVYKILNYFLTTLHKRIGNTG